MFWVSRKGLVEEIRQSLFPNGTDDDNNNNKIRTFSKVPHLLWTDNNNLSWEIHLKCWLITTRLKDLLWNTAKAHFHFQNTAHHAVNFSRSPQAFYWQPSYSTKSWPSWPKSNMQVRKMVEFQPPKISFCIPLLTSWKTAFRKWHLFFFFCILSSLVPMLQRKRKRSVTKCRKWFSRDVWATSTARKAWP